METTRIQSNTAETVFFLLLDASGNAVTGLTGAQLNQLTLMRKSDGKFWDGDSWETAKTSLAVIEQGAVNSPGLYYYTSPALAEGEYVVTVDTSYAENVPQIGQIKAGSYVDYLSATNGIVTDIQDIVKNKMTIDKAAGKLKLWNDAGDSVIYEWPLTDIDGSAVSIGAGAPANRGVPA